MQKTFLPLIPLLFSLLALVPSSAQADVEGLACVTDGNTMSIGGHRTSSRCQGGVAIRLFGIDAPDLAQTCQAANNTEWQCGRAAAGNLLELVKGQSVLCTGNSRDSAGRLVTLCQIGDRDIGREMVRRGWAMALGRESTMYELDEGDAHAATLGLWQSRFEVPADWRRKHSK